LAGPLFRAKLSALAYLGLMYDFCLPTRGLQVPAGPEWLHEIKYGGFRMLVQRDGKRVRLITRGGYDWTRRYAWIVQPR
jgi:bifunctional non-homologous end joining protein LigD